MSDDGEIPLDNSPRGDEGLEIKKKEEDEDGLEEGEILEEEGKSGSVGRLPVLEPLPGRRGLLGDASMGVSAWARGVRLGKAIPKESQKRRETDADFGEKRVNLKIAQDDCHVAKRNVEKDKRVVVNDKEKLRTSKEKRAFLRRNVEKSRSRYRSNSSSSGSSGGSLRVIQKVSREITRRRIAKPTEKRSLRRSPSPRRGRARLASPAQRERSRRSIFQRQQEQTRNYRSKFQRRDSSSRSRERFRKSRRPSRSSSRRCNNQKRAKSSDSSSSSSLDVSHIVKRKSEIAKSVLKSEAKKVTPTTGSKKVFERENLGDEKKVREEKKKSEPRCRRDETNKQLRPPKEFILKKKIEK